MNTSKAGDTSGATNVRERILETASALFYKQGVRAVGVDLVVAQAGIAKASLYRHFRTKDDLIAAFLQREDEHFWHCWDLVTQAHAGDPDAELDAHCRWIGERVERLNYRGCPQINVAAEFPDPEHPARKVALAHKQQLRSRLADIAVRLGAKRPDELAGQLSLLFNGAFVSSPIFFAGEAALLLQTTVHVLAAAARKP
jgi:AcrR family transcriptional regulator